MGISKCLELLGDKITDLEFNLKWAQDSCDSKDKTINELKAKIAELEEKRNG